MDHHNFQDENLYLNTRIYNTLYIFFSLFKKKNKNNIKTIKTNTDSSSYSSTFSNELHFSTIILNINKILFTNLDKILIKSTALYNRRIMKTIIYIDTRQTYRSVTILIYPFRSTSSRLFKSSLKSVTDHAGLSLFRENKVSSKLQLQTETGLFQGGESHCPLALRFIISKELHHFSFSNF